MFLEVEDTCCTPFNIAFYETKHKEKVKMKNISHGYSKSKAAAFNKTFDG